MVSWPSLTLQSKARTLALLSSTSSLSSRAARAAKARMLANDARSSSQASATPPRPVEPSMSRRAASALSRLRQASTTLAAPRRTKWRAASSPSPAAPPRRRAVSLFAAASRPGPPGPLTAVCARDDDGAPRAVAVGIRQRLELAQQRAQQSHRARPVAPVFARGPANGPAKARLATYPRPRELDPCALTIFFARVAGGHPGTNQVHKTRITTHNHPPDSNQDPRLRAARPWAFPSGRRSWVGASPVSYHEPRHGSGLRLRRLLQ